MLFQHGDGALPFAAEHIFPPEVVAVTVVVRLFAHRKLQKRQILPARFAGVGMVVKLHTLSVNKLLCTLAGVFQHLMHRALPAVAAVFVDLIRPKDAALAPIGEEAPCVAVTSARCVRPPRFLQLFAPAGAELFVKVDAAAEVGGLWDERQRFVARCVKAPRRDDLLRNMRAADAQLFDRIVRRASVEHTDVVRFGRGVHETLNKLRLIFADGVNTDSVGNGDHLLILYVWRRGVRRTAFA